MTTKLMRSTIAAAALAATSLAVTSLAAQAADKRVPVYKAPPPVAAWSWTGFYAGGSVGGRWANNTWTTSNPLPLLSGAATPNADPFNSAALRIGGYGGLNWQFAPTWVAGIEADFGWADNRKSGRLPGGPFTFVLAGVVTTTGNPRAFVNDTWDASLRARLGTLITPNTLLFGTGGAAWQRVEIGAFCDVFGTSTSFCTVPHDESYSKILAGWTIGAGVEHRIWDNWLARIEYRYADFGSFTQLFFNTFGGACGGCDDRFTANVTTRTHTLDLGLAYKF
jgi:outer membrane immunogenic protein